MEVQRYSKDINLSSLLNRNCEGAISKVVQMPNKVALPVAPAEQPVENVKLGPKVLMSGYMTKRTRTMSMWKQRWWQLKEDGMLLYYSPEGHPQKFLGEIDIGKTCYDVKSGLDTRIKFPRAVPSCCCFSFAVLKRVFHVYTPTPDESNKWVKAISEVSRVINRKIVAGLERRKAPKLPGANAEFRITRIKVKGLADSYQDISKVQYMPLERNRLALMSKRKIAGSLPDYLDRVGINEEPSSIHSVEGITRKARYEQSRNSLQLQKEQLEELRRKQEKLQARALRLQSYSMEDITSLHSQRKPVPTPRKGKEKFSNIFSEANHQSVIDSASDITTTSEHNLSVPSRNSNSSLPFIFSPPLSPPPLPPRGKIDTVPPPPLTSPPHSQPRLSISGELSGKHYKEEEDREVVPAPISLPPVQREGNIAQPVHTREDSVSPRAFQNVPKFVVPPPPSS